MESAKAPFVKRVFRWLACTRRPLLIYELQEAVAFDQSDKCWDPEKIPDADLLLQGCHSLVVRDDENATVRFAHHTVQQYLMATSSSQYQISEEITVRDFQFRMPDAQREAAIVCITYLSFSDFETAIASWPSEVQFNNTGIFGPGGAGSIPSTLGLGKPIVNVIYRMLGGRARPSALNVDYAKYLNVRPNSVKFDSGDKYKLQEYIANNWPWHVDACTSLDTREIGLLNDLVRYKSLPFEFRPWGSNRHFGPYGCKSCWTNNGKDLKSGDLSMTSMIHWTAEHGLETLLSYVTQRDALSSYLFRPEVIYDYFIHEEYSNETLLIACRNGQSKMFDWLINNHRRSGIKIRSYSSLCMAAAACGHATILEVLFRSVDEVNSPFSQLQASAISDIVQKSLSNAATSGYSLVIDVLLREGTARFSSEVKSSITSLDDFTGMTPLHSAAANGHHGVVRLLARACSNVDFRIPKSNSTALHCAAKNGHVKTVAELLSCGCSVECRDNENMTPLLLAAKNGHPAAVKCLLEAGSSVLESGGYLTDRRPRNPFLMEVPLGPLTWAAANGHTKVVNILLDCDPTLHETSVMGCTAVHLAAFYGHVQTLEKLFERGAEDVACPMIYPEPWTELWGRYGIHFAACNGQCSCLEYLAKRASPDVVTDKKDIAETALHIATAGGHCNAILALGRLGADLKIGNYRGETAFEVSISNKNKATALALLQAEQAQHHRPQLWKLLSLTEHKFAFDGALYKFGSEKTPQQCIDRGEFNESDVLYANEILKQSVENDMDPAFQLQLQEAIGRQILAK